MDHYAISTSLYISIRAFKSITHRFTGYKTLNTSNYHKIIGHLRFFSRLNFVTKIGIRRKEKQSST